MLLLVAEEGLQFTSLTVILLRVLNKEKALPRWSVATVFFIFILLQGQALDESENKKALPFHGKAFSLVAEEGFEPPTFGL